MPAAIPPDICCMEEFTLINAPLSCGSGIAVISAEAGMMRDIIPANKITFKTMATYNGVTDRLQYIPTIIMAIIDPITKTLYFPILSLSFPANGPAARENKPVQKYSMGN